MKNVFLFIGVLVGIFWQQVYFALNIDPVDYLWGFDSNSAKEKVVASTKPVSTTPSKPNIPVRRSEPPPKPIVVLYATSWCPYCKKAREYFKANNVQYLEYDIEKDEQAKRMYDLVGGSGVPVILVNGKKIQGFNRAKFEALYR